MGGRIWNYHELEFEVDYVNGVLIPEPQDIMMV